MKAKQRNGLTHKEAGRLGALRSNETKFLLKESRIKKYLTNPTTCNHCKSELSYRERNKKFCNQSCAATHHNELRKVRSLCLNSSCKKEIFGNSKQKYCCKKCQQAKQRQDYLDRWKAGREKGWTSKTIIISSIVRDYLFIKFNNKCSSCNWGEKNGFTNRIPLQVHHIDGDAKNCREENLDLLCPNCHSLTENFGRNNKQSARTNRYA
jgi:hypothetical protein